MLTRTALLLYIRVVRRRPAINATTFKEVFAFSKVWKKKRLTKFWQKYFGECCEFWFFFKTANEKYPVFGIGGSALRGYISLSRFRNGEEKGGSFTLCRFYPDCSLVQLHHFAADGQPDTGTFALRTGQLCKNF